MGPVDVLIVTVDVAPSLTNLMPNVRLALFATILLPGSDRKLERQ